MRAVAMVLLRGLRQRWWLSSGVIALTVSAVVAGAIGPIYLVSSMTSLRVDRIAAKSGSDKNMSWEFVADADSSWEEIRTDAVAAVTGGRVDADYYASPQVAWVSEERVTRAPGVGDFEWQMEARAGDCEHVIVVEGRCPRGPRELMVAEIDVRRGGFSGGSTTDLGGLTGTMRIVGSYRLDDPNSDYWYDPVRYASVPRQGSPGTSGYVRYGPAPFLVLPNAVATLPAGERIVRVDRAIQVPADLDQDTLDRLADTAVAESSRSGVAVRGGKLRPAARAGLDGIRDEIAAETDVATRTILPASLSLIVVCVVLLFRLVAAAAELRRPEIALLKVRGWAGRRLRAMTLAEPLVLLITGWVAGTLLIEPAGRALVAAWLRPGTPATFSYPAGSMSIAVILVAFVAVLLATRGVATESLRTQLEVAPAPPMQARRSVRVLRILVVVVALVAVALAVAANSSESPTVISHVMPAVVGIAVAVVATELILRAGRWFVGFTARRASTVRFLQVRAVARRREGTLLVLPVTVAMAVSVFAVGVWSTAEQWRASASAAEVGAARSYAAPMNPVAAMSLTHELDPQGSWLMATAATSIGDTRILVDTPRLEQVARWPDSWTGEGSLPHVVDELRPTPVPEIRGAELSVEASVDLRSTQRLYITVTLLDAGGDVRSVSLGPYPQGRHVRAANVGSCERACEMIRVQVGGVAGSLGPMEGEVTLGDVRVDGAQQGIFGAEFTPGWELAPEITGAPDVDCTSGEHTTTIDVDSHGTPTSLTLVPHGTPAAIPVVAGRDAPGLGVDATSDLSAPTSEAQPDLRRVRTAEAVPVVGSAGVMVDLTTMARASSDLRMRGGVRILATDDTPVSVVQRLGEAGVDTEDPVLLSEVRSNYDNEAYALALRLYLVAAAGTLALAVIGVVVSLAVQVRARRKDAAALRVTGVRERSVWLAGMLEICSVIGVAVVLGTAAGVGAAQIVVRGTRLGTVAPGTPRVLTDVDLPLLLLMAGGVLAVLAVVATVVARTVVHAGRPSLLRTDA